MAGKCLSKLIRACEGGLTEKVSKPQKFPFSGSEKFKTTFNKHVCLMQISCHADVDVGHKQPTHKTLKKIIFAEKCERRENSITWNCDMFAIVMETRTVNVIFLSGTR
jgi:hypothetical protein